MSNTAQDALAAVVVCVGLAVTRVVADHVIKAYYERKAHKANKGQRADRSKKVAAAIKARLESQTPTLHNAASA